MASVAVQRFSGAYRALREPSCFAFACLTQASSGTAANHQTSRQRCAATATLRRSSGSRASSPSPWSSHPR
jgi:hypothetical protein